MASCCRCLSRLLLFLVVLAGFSVLYYIDVFKVDKRLQGSPLQFNLNNDYATYSPKASSEEKEASFPLDSITDIDDDSSASSYNSSISVPKAIRLIHRFTNSIQSVDDERQFIGKAEQSGPNWKRKPGYLYDLMVPLYRKKGNRKWMDAGSSVSKLLSVLWDETDWHSSSLYDPLTGWFAFSHCFTPRNKRFTSVNKNLRDTYLEK